MATLNKPCYMKRYILFLVGFNGKSLLIVNKAVMSTATICHDFTSHSRDWTEK